MLLPFINEFSSASFLAIFYSSKGKHTTEGAHVSCSSGPGERPLHGRQHSLTPRSAEGRVALISSALFLLPGGLNTSRTSWCCRETHAAEERRRWERRKGELEEKRGKGGGKGRQGCEKGGDWQENEAKCKCCTSPPPLVCFNIQILTSCLAVLGRCCPSGSLAPREGLRAASTGQRLLWVLCSCNNSTVCCTHSSIPDPSVTMSSTNSHFFSVCRRNQR